MVGDVGAVGRVGGLMSSPFERLVERGARADAVARGVDAYMAQRVWVEGTRRSWLWVDVRIVCADGESLASTGGRAVGLPVVSVGLASWLIWRRLRRLSIDEILESKGL